LITLKQPYKTHGLAILYLKEWLITLLRLG